MESNMTPVIPGWAVTIFRIAAGNLCCVNIMRRTMGEARDRMNSARVGSATQMIYRD